MPRRGVVQIPSALDDLLLSLDAMQLSGDESTPFPLQHKRNLGGITLSYTRASKLPRQPHAPSLGELADDYLQSHGYDLEAMCTIAETYKHSSTAEEFSMSLASSGFAVAEALFLHRLIERF
jgi:hypothetical protein